MAPRCFICQGTEFDRFIAAYRRCRGCGHETLVDPVTQAYMLNDPLSLEEAGRVSLLDRFQDAVLEHFRGNASAGQWVDIGSGSGKLLFRNRSRFTRQAGVEITPAAVEFSRRVLGLGIVTELEAIDGEITFATAWHSLEHFSPPALVSLLATLATRMPAGGRFIVSVPNGASWQYRCFREQYAFFDVPNHLQQFTPDSLDRLLAAHDFKCISSVRSWPYNIFGYVQALLNLIMRDHNYLYYRLKRRRPSRSAWRDVINVSLLPVLLPLGTGLGLLDALRPSRQGVLTLCFEKRG